METVEGVKTHRLAIVGFGNVGRAFVRLLRSKRELLLRDYGIDFLVTGIASRRIGWLVDPGGFDLNTVCEGNIPRLGSLQRGGSEASNPRVAPASGPTDVREWLKRARATALFEATSLNRETGEPAAAHIRAALQCGAHAISANKGPVVFHHRELTELAQAVGKRFLFESSVMDGMPIFNMFRECLPALDLRGLRGVLNSTTNVILSGMEQGLSFAEALRQAQEIGVAETDPTDDIDGWDAAVKTVVLANVLMGARLHPADVDRQGIRELTGEQVRGARAGGKSYKLVCRAYRRDGRVLASVRPEQVSLSDPLALVEGTSSIVYFETDMFPGLALTEDHAGLEATAYGLLADFISAVRS